MVLGVVVCIAGPALLESAEEVPRVVTAVGSNQSLPYTVAVVEEVVVGVVGGTSRFVDHF